MESSDVKTKKTLVVAAICLPPCLIGPAILTSNLFRHFPKGSYHVLTGRLDHLWLPIDEDSMLPAQYTFTRFPVLHSRGSLRRRIRSFFRDIFVLLEVTWKGLQIIRRESIESIFVVADHYVELAALLMHWLTGRKIVLWLPDLYYVPDSSKNDWTQGADKVLEPFVLRAVDTVLVTGEPTQEYYWEKYRIQTVVLPHSADLNKYIGMPNQTYQRRNIKDILFTGSVIDANEGGILDMVNVINEFPELDARLKIFSNVSPDHLQSIGIAGPRVICGQANRADIAALQLSADVLFLPLSFERHGYHMSSIVQTASPSKLPEYLAAGRPILIYAPSGSYYSRYAQREGFGLVIDKPDPDLLRQALIDLHRDEALRRRLTDNALRVAKEHHDAEKISTRLQCLLGVAELCLLILC